MIQCNRGSSSLRLGDEKDLEGIVGVGVLLRSISDPLSDLGSVFPCEGVRFFLNSRSKQAKKPLEEPWMNLVASVVLVADGKVKRDGQRSKCVEVEFWWLKPWMERFFSENCSNEMSWGVNRQLNCVSKKKKSQNCQKQDGSTTKKAFMVWDRADIDSLCCYESLNDATEDEGSDSSQSEVVSETSSREIDSVELEYEIKYCCADSKLKDCDCNLKVVELWAEARSIAYKISMLKNESIKHFGYLVPADEIGWVKAGYYRSLPKIYKKKFKNEKKRKSRQYYADHLEEKARQNAWFRFWWHPVTQFLYLCFTVSIALIVFFLRLVGFDTFIGDKYDDLSSVEAGLSAFFGIVVLFILLDKKVKEAIKFWSLRKKIDKSRKRRLKNWKNDN